MDVSPATSPDVSPAAASDTSHLEAEDVSAACRGDAWELELESRRAARGALEAFGASRPTEYSSDASRGSAETRRDLKGATRSAAPARTGPAVAAGVSFAAAGIAAELASVAASQRARAASRQAPSSSAIARPHASAVSLQRSAK